MVYKLGLSAEKGWRKLRGFRRLADVINGVKFIDGIDEETLTLHRLGMFQKLGISFKTTNCIENIMRQVGIYKDRVSYWKNSDQRQRWVERLYKKSSLS
jgi:hypothetical protein